MPKEAFELLRRHDAGQCVTPTSFSITFLEEAPRPLPARFNPKPMPKAPPLPAPSGATLLFSNLTTTLSRVTEKVPPIFPEKKRETIYCGS
jgi:hypothetical protein